VQELLQKFEADLEEVALIPADGGRFEVLLDDRLIYSKLETGRHPAAGEVAGLVGGSLGQ
jgi:selenoprotein W-related protein